ncbi:hypothetical protein D3C80_1819800 [compost metagenome]
MLKPTPDKIVAAAIEAVAVPAAVADTAAPHAAIVVPAVKNAATKATAPMTSCKVPPRFAPSMTGTMVYSVAAADMSNSSIEMLFLPL